MDSQIRKLDSIMSMLDTGTSKATPSRLQSRHTSLAPIDKCKLRGGHASTESELAFETFKDKLRMERDKKLPCKPAQDPLKKNKDADKITALARFTIMKQQKRYDLISICTKNALDRESNETFYLHMYLNSLVPFFYQYDADTMKKLSFCLLYRKFEPGQTIFAMGDPAVDFYLILSGQVE